MKNKEKQFKEVYNKSKDKIYRLCLGFMGNNSDADDLFQEVIIKVWNSLESFRKHSNVTTWIYRITTNTALLTLNRRNILNTKKEEYQPEVMHCRLDSSETNSKEQQVKKHEQRLQAVYAGIPSVRASHTVSRKINHYDFKSIVVYLLT